MMLRGYRVKVNENYSGTIPIANIQERYRKQSIAEY